MRCTPRRRVTATYPEAVAALTRAEASRRLSHEEAEEAFAELAANFGTTGKPLYEVIEPVRVLVDHAAALARRHRLRGFDAVHLATGLAARYAAPPEDELRFPLGTRPAPDPMKQPEIPIFYAPEQSASANRSYSPSAQKPALVVAAWQQSGIPIRIVRPTPVTLTDLCRVHDPAYVRGVLAGRIKNGFGNTLAEIAATLPWTSGSLLSAADHAATTGESAFAPAGGFHHAGCDQGHAFCTFNGLLVAALSLHVRRLVRHVAIIDCDQHFGDGTRDGIRRLGLDWIGFYSYGAAPPTTRETAEDWLDSLPEIIASTAAGSDVVFYQAGADPHEKDPWGGCLSSEQLARRDRIVFQACRDLGVPVVSTLEGGYQKPVEKVVAIHVQTLLQFAGVHGIARSSG